MMKQYPDQKNLGYLRNFYRIHLEKYIFFYARKFFILKVYFSLRKLIKTLFNLYDLRIFYSKHLARFEVFRQLKKLILIFYFKYPGISTIKSRLWSTNRIFRLIPMRDFKVQQRITSILIAPSATNKISGPEFIGNYPIKLHRTETVSINMPQIEVIIIPKATVIGGTNLIICGSHAIHPDLMVPARDIVRAELDNVASVDLNRTEICLLWPRRVRRMGKAISLLGECTGNYAHWLIEILPKLLIVDTLKEFDGLPLLVDGWIHPHCRASIELLGLGKRPLIEVGLWKVVHLSDVVEISPPAYIPPESRVYLNECAVPEPDPQIFAYSKIAFEMLRDSAHASVSAYKVKSRRKLYLHRAAKSVGQGRFIVNLEEVERLIYAHGFEMIDPIDLSFVEQIAIFRDASCIISPVGAALANTIFTNPGCKIIALAAFYENADYYFFSNLMGILGHDMRYVLGPQIETTDGHIANRNYFIDIDALREALESL